MKILLFQLIFLFFVINLCFSQELIRNFSHMSDSMQLTAIRQKCNEISQQKLSFDQTRDSLEKVQLFCQKNRSKKSEAMVLVSMFQLYSINANRASDSLYSIIRKNFFSEMSPYLKCYVNHFHGANLVNNGRTDSAINVYFENIENCVDDNAVKFQYLANEGLAAIYHRLNQNKKAIYYFKRMVPFLDGGNNNKIILRDTYYNISLLYDGISEIDSAYSYAIRSYNVEPTSLNTSSLAKIHLNKKTNWYDLEKAGEYLDLVKSLFTNSSQSKRTFENIYAIYYRERGMLDSAIWYNNLAIERAKELNNPEMILLSYKQLSKNLLDGNEWIIDSINFYQNKLYDKDVMSSTIDYETRYKTKEKEAHLLAEQNKNLKINTYVQYGVLSVIIVGGLIFILFTFRSRKKNREIENLKRQALKLQMNPHFFFNSLNSINGFIVGNDKKSARRYLATFSNLMRSTLENSEHDFISIKDEVAYLSSYLSLEQIRTNSFEFKFQYDDKLSEKKIPSMLIQPLVENCVKHAFNDKNGEIIVDLRASALGFITINVKDNGSGFKQEKNSEQSMAIRILKSRLKLFSKKNNHLLISQSSNGTSVTLTVPSYE